MTLLLDEADYATIQLIGCWQLDQILRYLHISACLITQYHVSIMMQNSVFYSTSS